MKTFFSNKAAASFYGNSNYTVVYHASNIEIICKLYNEKGKSIGYTHLYLSFCGSDSVIIYANWDGFLCHLDSVKDMNHFASIMKRPCPKFYNLLTNENPSDINVMRLPEYDIHVIGKELHISLADDYAPMALPFRKDVMDAVTKLSNTLLDLYLEISKACPLSLWKERLSALWG